LAFGAADLALHVARTIEEERMWHGCAERRRCVLRITRDADANADVAPESDTNRDIERRPRLHFVIGREPAVLGVLTERHCLAEVVATRLESTIHRHVDPVDRLWRRGLRLPGS